MINKKEFKYYLENFYGYGKWSSDIWFIGKEEGGGNSQQECFKKIKIFNMLGQDKESLLDLREYHLMLNGRESKWFLPDFPLQSTWKLYLFLIMDKALFGNSGEKKKFQSRYLARDLYFQDSIRSHALIELLPLPNPYDDNEWPKRWPIWQREFVDVFDRDFLPDNKQQYRDQFIPPRIKFLYGQINDYNPKFIVSPTISSGTYLPYWEQLINLIDGSYDIKKWVNVPHPHPNNQYVSRYYQLSSLDLKIILTYQPTLFISGTGNWINFFSVIKQLI